MKRTPAWVFVAAVAVQLAALGLCVFAMEHWSRVAETPEADAEPEPSEEPPAPRREALQPSPPLVAADVAFARERPAPSVPVPSPPEPPRPQAAEPPAQPRVAELPRFVVPQATEPRAPAATPRPLFGPPPERAAEPAGEPRPPASANASPPLPPQAEPFRPRFAPLDTERATQAPAANGIPAYITEGADGTTQLVTGAVGDQPVTFGFYPDGNIRYVDVDGGRYAGKAESARARMREVDGTRAFTVQIGVAADGRLQATFTGGLHDAATFPLEPLVGWSVA